MRVRLDGTDFQVSEHWREPLTKLVQNLHSVCQHEMYDGVSGAPLLNHCGQKKIAAIKAVRAATGLNLKDAKAIADKAPVRLPVMSFEKAAEFVREINSFGGSAKLPDPPVIDRLAALGKTIEEETPVAEELYTRYMQLQVAQAKILQLGEMNGVFRDKIESQLSS